MTEDILTSALRVLAHNDPVLRANLRGLGEGLIALAERTSEVESEPLADIAETQTPQPVLEEPVAQPEEPPVAVMVDPADGAGSNVRASHGTHVEPPALEPPAPRGEEPSSSPNEPTGVLGVPVMAASLGPRAPEPVRIVPPTDEDLPEIERALRLKAEASRWSIERARAGIGGNGGDHPELLARARDAGVDLWMAHPGFAHEAALMTRLANAFETAADAVGLVMALPAAAQNGSGSGHRLESFRLLAAAQSALRTAVADVVTRRDNDQDRIFLWLKAATAEKHLYVERHMRLDDPANPAEPPAIASRIALVRGMVAEIVEREERESKRWRQLDYHVGLIGRGTGSPHDWEKVADVIDAMVAEGLPPSNVGLRDRLLPIYGGRPDLSAHSGFGLVVRELDAAAARALPLTVPMGKVEEKRSPTANGSTPAIDAVRARLSGGTVVMIGGVPKANAKRAIEEALGLREVIWVESKPHQSTDVVSRAIARPDVRVALLLVRWSKYSTTDLDRICAAHNTPLVRVSQGYNPGRIAADIIAQRGKMLGIEEPAAIGARG